MSEMEEYACLTANEAKAPMDNDGPAIGGGEASYTAATVPQIEAKQTPVSVYTYQPQPLWQSRDPSEDHLQRQVAAASADRMYAISIGWCIVCCLCGSPLTLACFIPAIIMSTKVIMGSYITH